MKSLRVNYTRKSQKAEDRSAYLSFADAVKNKRFSRKTILKNFGKLIPTYEYDSEDKRLLIDHLYELSNPTVESQIED